MTGRCSGLRVFNEENQDIFLRLLLKVIPKALTDNPFPF